LTTGHQELLQMIKDVVILTGEPPVLTSQLGAESLESPDIFVTWIDGGMVETCCGSGTGRCEKR
jgi:hypothetical protein